jgi:hypothetical protein
MPINLTGSTIASTFGQMLHINGGPEATEKIVYSGTGVATALKLGVTSASVENIQLNGNVISTLNTDGDLTLSPNGTGSVVISKVSFSDAAQARTSLGLGTIATQNANAVSITGGAISNVSFSGSFSGMTTLSAVEYVTSNATANLQITTNGITAGGTNTNVDINLTPKGVGEVNVTNIDVLSGKVPFNTITNRAYASFFDAGTTDQTGSTTDRTAVKWATAAVTGAGITVASNSQITLAAAGTYRFNASLQFSNSVNNASVVYVWFAKNGTNIASSAAKLTVPKSSEGGTYLAAYEIFETVAANDYIEMYWYPDNVGTTLHYIAAVASNPGVTPAIPIVPPAIVVVERVA